MSTPSESATLPETRRPLPEERQVQTSHSTLVGGSVLPYTATVGIQHLETTEAAPRAAVFSVAYTLDGVEDPSRRPVTFCFNGGPGSSSVWLHMGAYGPQRIVLPDPEAAPPPPYELVDNAYGLLHLTDLVFIDPVGTGFSQAEDSDKGAGPFHGIEGDTDSVGRFILGWLNRNGRWASPKLLSGESYGTTRSAALAGWLADRGCVLNGLALVSVALQFQTFVATASNDLALQCFLPGLVATAAWHGRVALPLPGGLDALIDEARTFARDVYGPALFEGSGLSDDRKQAVATELSRLTGLDAAAIADRDLRVDPMWFTKQLLDGTDRVVGRLDGRYVGRDGSPDQAMAQRDPSYDAALGAYTALVNDHLRRTLGWETEQVYEVLSMEVNRSWDWRAEGAPFGFPDTSAKLRTAMLASPGTKVLMANGLYDLATPFGATEYTASHLRLPEELRGNLRMTYYPAGHMMYFHQPSLEQLQRDLEAFYAWACPGC